MQEEDQPIELADILNASHENKWVALAPDYRSVVAASDNLAQLMRQVGDQNVVFHRVLPHDVSFAPLLR